MAGCPDLITGDAPKQGPQRVMAAMIGMSKINIEGLRKAYESMMKQLSWALTMDPGITRGDKMQREPKESVYYRIWPPVKFAVADVAVKLVIQRL